MPIFDTSCLYTTIKNVSGQKKTFSFLPPHGKTLAAGEELTIFGSIYDALRSSPAKERAVQAFDRAVANGDLIVVQSPAVILKDKATNAVKMLELNNGTLQANDPSWTNSVSL